MSDTAATTRKRRKKVLASRWKLNSSMNKSSISLNISKGKYILLQKSKESLQMNNKNLALALQEARCKLAEKEQILNETTINSKKIKEVQKNMVEMHAVLQSFMKNFHDTLLLLQVDDSKISSFTTPFSFCTKFQKKMPDLTESVDEVLEENLVLSEQKAKCDKITKKSSNLMISKKQTSNKDCTPMEISDKVDDKVTKTLHDNPFQVLEKNVPIDKSKNSEGPINQSKESMTGVNDEISCFSLEKTPKLMIANLEPLFLKSSHSTTSLLNENSSPPVTNPKKVLNFTAIPSQKIKGSKIPRLHFRDIIKNNAKSSDVINKENFASQNIISDKNLSVTEENEKCRRKTFVVKNSNIVDIPEPTIAINQEKVLNENKSNIDCDSEKVSRRKTFVVSSNSPEKNNKSTSDRRKTFVKKSDDKIKTGKSTRKTFVVCEKEKNSANDNEDVQEELCLLGSILETNEILPSICTSRLNPLLESLSPSKKTSIEVNHCGLEVTEFNQKKVKSYKSDIKKSLSMVEKNRRVTFFDDQNKNVETFSDTEITPPENSSQDFEFEKKSKGINESASRENELQICEDNNTNKKKNNFKTEKSSVKVNSNSMKKMAEIPIDADLTLKYCTNTVSEETELLKVSELKQSQQEECCNNIEDVDESSLKRKKKNRQESRNSKVRKTVTKFSETSCPKSTPVIENASQSKESKLVINETVNVIFKDEKQNKKETPKSTLSEKTELLKLDAADESNTQKTIQNDDIEILDENVYRSHNHVSYKMFLESSDSDCESISELDLPSFKVELPKKSIPIRGKVSYSKKQKKYVFSSHKKKSVSKKKSLCKYTPKSENHTSLLNECRSVSHSNTTHSENRDNISTCENQIEENVRGNNVDLASEVYERETACVIDSEKQIKISPSIVMKNAENHGNNNDLGNKNDETQTHNFADCKKDKDMKNILYNRYSPVIALDSALNMIERDSELLGLHSKNLSDKPTVTNLSEVGKSNEKSNNRARKKGKISKHPSEENIPVDTIAIKKNLNKNKLKKKEKVLPDLGKENVCDLLKSKSAVKSKKQNNKIEEKFPTDIADVNAIVVQAEVHPLPQSLNGIETSIKEDDSCKLKNLQVAVVLNDIFQSKDNNLVSSKSKKKFIAEGGQFPLKGLLTENSSNVQVLTESNPGVKYEKIANYQELRTRKRNQRPNYAEPKLNKKMRR